jgi:hypothetical protein
MRPSLKDYLRTGKVRLEPLETEATSLSSEATTPSSNSVSSPEPSVAGKKKASQGEPKASAKATGKKVPREKREKNVPAVSPNSSASPVVKTSPSPSGENAPEPLGVLFLNMLSESDRGTWEPILRAGTEIVSLPADFVALREEFRTMDRSRFTFYILDSPGTNLRSLRTSVQIRDPMTLLLRWDETGTLTLFGMAPSRNAPR